MKELTNELIAAAIEAVDSEIVYVKKRLGENTPLVALYAVCGTALSELQERRAATAQPVIPEHRQMVPDEIMPSGLVYSSVLPEFESNDSDKVVGYHCLVHGKTRSVMTQEQAYSDAMLVVEACRAAFVSTAQPISEPYKLNDWISVDEKMPEAYEAVLVHQQGGIIFCAEVEDGWFYPDEFPNVDKQGRDITHWMPLPAAPAQESE